MLKTRLKWLKKQWETKKANRILNQILKQSNKEKIIFIGSPLHGNLGDHAISIAEMKLFQTIPQKEIIEIPGAYYLLCRSRIKKYVKTSDTIVITGGGFIGTLWQNEEELVKQILEDFSDNKTVIMPQTFYFDETLEGKKELAHFQNLVLNHKHLYIYTRERNSYEFCQKNFSTQNTFLVPDIVLYLNYDQATTKREGVLFCLRSDKEKVISDSVLESLLQELKQENIMVKKTTTVLSQNISLDQRKEYLDQKLKEFQNSEVVVTDRLHGMIFAAITGTPCIALDNLSHKVKGVYEWLKPLDYIKFVDSYVDFLPLIEEMKQKKDTHYQLDQHYQSEFKKITATIEK